MKRPDSLIDSEQISWRTGCEASPLPPKSLVGNNYNKQNVSGRGPSVVISSGTLTFRPHFRVGNGILADVCNVLAPKLETWPDVNPPVWLFFLPR